MNGCYMLLDGIFVIIKGKYIGPEKPGPWANLFYKLDFNVFKLGPVFIIFGVLWLTCTTPLNSQTKLRKQNCNFATWKRKNLTGRIK